MVSPPSLTSSELSFPCNMVALDMGLLLSLLLGNNHRSDKYHVDMFVIEFWFQCHTSPNKPLSFDSMATTSDTGHLCNRRFVDGCRDNRHLARRLCTRVHGSYYPHHMQLNIQSHPTQPTRPSVDTVRVRNCCARSICQCMVR